MTKQYRSLPIKSANDENAYCKLNERELEIINLLIELSG
jgi:hypothetical protein